MTRRLPLSALLICFALVAGGACDGTFSQSGLEDRDPSDDGDGLEASCQVDTDCELVASSCCECPTFAASVDFGRSCDGIDCPRAPECAPAEATCNEGQCTLVCSAVTTTQECDGGFAVDEAGCTLDECIPSLAPECVSDVDCVIVPADCCGCELGGNDTAVAADAEQEHLGSLTCEGPVSCPGVSSCEADASATCLGGRCRYVSGVGLDSPPPLCGTTDTGACAVGEVCVLNSTEPGAIPGIGVCRPE